MTGVSKWFLHEDGRLRAGWRLLFFAFVFIILLVPLQWSASSFVRETPSLSPIFKSLLFVIAFSSAVFFSTWMMMRLFDRQPFSSVGFKRFSAWSDSVRGIALGAGLAALTAMGEWATGSIHFESSNVDGWIAVNSLAGITCIFVLSALNEEMLFRGYPFQRLIEGTSGWAALVLSSLLFGVMHWRNPHATIFSVSNTILAGVLISVGYLKTRALWLPLGFHFAWNWSLFAMGLPVSGMEIGRIRWRAIPVDGLVWLSGGDYGPEGGAIATVALSAGVMILWCMRFTREAGNLSEVESIMNTDETTDPNLPLKLQ